MWSMMQRAAASKIENLRKSVSTARPPRFRRLIGLILAGHRVDCRTRGRSSHIRHLHFSMSGDVPALAWQCVPLTSATAPLPGPRSATTCCLVAGVASGKQQGSAAAPEIFCYGGFGDGIERDEMFVINTDSHEVSTIVPLESFSQSFARAGHAAVYIPTSNTVYVFGGWNGKKYLNYGFLFDCQTSSVMLEKVQGRQLPTARRDHAMVHVPNTNRVWLFGGWNCVDQILDVWTMDESWDWSPVVGLKGEAPPTLRGHSVCASGDHVFVFGGLHGLSRYTNDLHVLDTRTLEWFRVPDGGNGTPPPPRAWHGAVMMGKMMIVCGGTAGRSQFYDDVYLLDTEQLMWYKLTIEGDSKPLARASHSCCAVGSKLYIFGGLTPVGRDANVTAQQDCWVLETGIETGGAAADGSA